ncbi:MAG: AtpZ/AtpI family protein [Candidatus Magasanikbacteria bacterium]
MTEDKSKKTSDREYWMFAMKIVGNFGATIAAPVVVFVMIGQYLDEKYSRGPWFTVLGFVVSALLTGLMIYRKAKKYSKEYEALDNHKNT